MLARTHPRAQGGGIEPFPGYHVGNRPLLAAYRLLIHRL